MTDHIAPGDALDPPFFVLIITKWLPLYLAKQQQSQKFLLLLPWLLLSSTPMSVLE